MRIVLVGTPAQQRRLRLELASSFDIAGEADSLAAARRFGADAYLVAADEDEEEPLVEHLTARETDVLTLVADGLSNKAIAARLGISDETIKFHLTSIFGKLGASNRTDAVRQALRRGLVPM
jgi:DNA-binding NarL/FixJ family response regulator